jgi:hypothetical protein
MPRSPAAKPRPVKVDSVMRYVQRTLGGTVIISLLLGVAVGAQADTTPSAKSKSKTPAAPPPPPTRYLPDRFAGAAGRYYRVIWGVDALSIKLVESGEIVRFSWRVLDADKAGALNDKRAVPALQDPAAGVSLVVPTMEQIGQLRQSSPPESGKSYWMAFSNKGRTVKRGDKVNVVIGQFHADGLAVD